MIKAWDMTNNTLLLDNGNEITIDKTTGIGSDDINYDLKYAQFNGNTIKQFSIPVTPEPITFKMVGMAELGEELTDDVMLEIKDFELDNTAAIGKRKAATRILFRMNTNFKMDVFGSEFTTMINQIGSNTSLGSIGATDLITKMQS